MRPIGRPEIEDPLKYAPFAGNDMQLAESGADGYLAAALQALGALCQLHDEIFRYVYGMENP
jgi:hypothetical protein